MNNKKDFKDLLIKNFKNKDFLIINKKNKSVKINNFFKSTSFVILISSLIPSLADMQMPVAIIGATGILFFDNKIRKAKELLDRKDDIVNEGYKNQLNSMELAEFRIKNLNDLKAGDISKEDYISLIQDELDLIYYLIKEECSNDLKVTVSLYKNDVEHIKEIINIALNGEFITKENARLLKNRWIFNIQSLYNKYSKTDIEEDLKYLQSYMKKKEV